MKSSFLVFFFKEKTAYEIKEGDWSSDVCSSDLDRRDHQQRSDMAAAARNGRQTVPNGRGRDRSRFDRPHYVRGHNARPCTRLRLQQHRRPAQRRETWARREHLSRSLSLHSATAVIARVLEQQVKHPPPGWIRKTSGLPRSWRTGCSPEPASTSRSSSFPRVIASVLVPTPRSAARPIERTGDSGSFHSALEVRC